VELQPVAHFRIRRLVNCPVALAAPTARSRTMMTSLAVVVVSMVRHRKCLAVVRAVVDARPARCRSFLVDYRNVSRNWMMMVVIERLVHCCRNLVEQPVVAAMMLSGRSLLEKVLPMVSCHNLAIGRAPVVEGLATRILVMEPAVMVTGILAVLGFVLVDRSRSVAVAQVLVELNCSWTDLVAATVAVHILVVLGFGQLVLVVESRFATQDSVQLLVGCS
jgi:hypothetical protein